MTQPSLILGTAGHIDHGKSTLIEALTGTDPDRLAEEKRRGITIELGFARLALPDGRTLGVVDVPGHERFVRQMIAGATGIDIALLCIAADDGIMPQTVEHLHVLELLGIPQMVVALTKSDLVDDEWIAFMKDEVANRLEATRYAGSPIVAMSARERSGLEELLETLQAAASHAKRSHGGAQEPARLPIDRAFTIKGAGTVVTGTLWSGTVRADDELELLPAGKRVRVRSIQEHGAPVDQALPGNRTALNLASVGTDEVRPGMFLAAPGTLSPTDRFDAQVTHLGSQRTPRPLQSGTHMRIAHGTAEATARLLLMDAMDSLEAGASALAQIRLNEPLPLAPGDRFVIRSESPVEVVGGGKVLLAHPRRRTNLRAGERTLLEALRDGDAQAAVDAAASLQPGPFASADIAAACELAEPLCTTQLQTLCERKALRKLGSADAKPLYAPPSLIQSLENSLESALMRFHADNPDKTGIGKAELAASAGKPLSPAALDALLAEMSDKGKAAIDGGEVSHPRAGAKARHQVEQAESLLLDELESAGLKPPAIDALAKRCGMGLQVARKALGALESEGKAVRIGDHCFAATALDQAKRLVATCIETEGPATAAQLKDALGVSRKHAIPLLEHLDRQGFTRREGDVRTLGGR